MKSFKQVSVILVVASLSLSCSQNGNQASSGKIVDNKLGVGSQIVAKPSAPITMSYNVLNSTAKVGEEIEISVEFQSTVASAIKVETTSHKKLSWLNAKNSWQSLQSKSGKRESIPNFKIKAAEEGVFYINLVASVIQNGKRLAKPFTIPVNIGEGSIPLKSVGEVIIDGKGQTVIVQKGDSSN